MCPTSLNFNNNSLSYPQNNLCSTSSSLIQFRSTYSHFHSRPITHVFYRYRLTLVSNIQRGKLFNVIYNLLQHSSIFHIFITAYYISSLYNFIYILLYLSRGTTAKKKKNNQVNGNMHFATSGPAHSIGVTCMQQKKEKEGGKNIPS